MTEGWIRSGRRPAAEGPAVNDEQWDAGAHVILRCTGLEPLVKQADSEIPVLPCPTLHVPAAPDHALT
jgi:aspartate racemase